MKRFFFILMSVLLALPVIGSPVLADESSDDLEDGLYTIDYEVLYNGSNEFDDLFTKPATLIVKDGQPSIVEMEYDGGYVFTDMKMTPGEVIDIKDSENGLELIVMDIQGNLNQDFILHLTNTYGERTRNHDLDLTFYPNTIKPFEESNPGYNNNENGSEEDGTSNDGENGENGNESDKENVGGDDDTSDDGNENENVGNEGTNEDPVNEDTSDGKKVDTGKSDEKQTDDNKDSQLLPDKAYEIDYIIKHETEDEPSAADTFFVKPGILLEKDGEYYLQLKVTGKEFILGVSNEFGELVMVEEGDDYYIYQLKLDGELTDTFNIDFSLFYGDHSARLILDSTNMVELDASDYELVPSNNGNGPSIEGEPIEDREKPQQPGQPTPSQPSTNDNDDGKKEKQPKKEDLLKPDKAYEIDYIVKHETEDKPSASDTFFVKPGILLEKDGEYYFQFRLNGKQYVNSIKNKFGELVVVSEGDDYVVYQLKVDGKLTDPIFVDFLLTVPGVYDNEKHTARIFLDPSSMEEVDASEYELVPSTNENGPTAPGAQNPDKKATLDPNTPEKPELGDGENGDNGSNNGSTDDNNLNPKTGEETNVLLYVLLLIGSAIPLAIKAKRRFA